MAREEQRQAALKEQRSRTLADASEKIRQANEAKYRESLDNPFGSNDRPTTAGSDVNSRLAIRMAASSHSAAQSEEITRQKANTLSNPSASGECPTTLAHLAPQLPEYSHSELTAVRNQILIEDVEADYQRLLSQQISPGAAARTFLKNANESEKQRVVAMQCMRTVTNNADQMRAALENGTYRFTGRGIADSCAASYVNMYYGAVAMREMAIIVSCMAQRER
ncbi:hypothetical protein AB4Z32_24870 [Massilia sp. 2TAF26]|uniref:hypothetical protein n=1 Tax=Massilia sp. 2TAF26 TaxID=3233012 RepID=UPI003F9681A7